MLTTLIDMNIINKIELNNKEINPKANEDLNEIPRT